MSTSVSSRVAAALCMALAITISWAGLGRVAALAAQQPSAVIVGAEQVDELLQSAEQLLRAEQYTAALASFERALDGARRLGLEEREARALGGLGEIQYQRADYPAVRAQALKSAQIYERLAAAESSARPSINIGFGRSHHLLSLVAAREGNLSEARQRAERAVAAFDAAGDRRGRAVSTYQLLQVGNFAEEERRVLIERVIADARAASDRVMEARALHGVGDRLFNTGNLAAALVQLEAVAAMFEETGRHVELGTTYNSIGRVYRAHGRLDAALASQLKALAIHEKADAPFNHLQSLNAVAVTYGALWDLRQARIYYERALGLAERTSTPRIQDFLRSNFAGILIEDGDYQKAAEILEGVIARGLDTYPGVRMRHLALALLGLDRAPAALRWAEKAVEGCGSPESRDCIRALDRRAEVHAALGNEGAALADLESAMKGIEATRSRSAPADFLKQQFHLAEEGLYSRAIALQLRRGRSAEALETAEHARARAFVDLLASRDLSISAGAGTARTGTPPTSSDPLSRLSLVFRGTSRRPSDVAAVGGGDLPSGTAAPAASSADLIATATRLRSTLIAYWVTHNQVFIWVASPDGTVRSSQVQVRSSKLLELIRASAPFGQPDRPAPRERQHVAVATRGAASIAAPASGSRPWRELYDLLVKPVRHALPRASGALLTIVPHGALAAVPFGGLQDERGRYLLEDYALHYAPSGAALQFTAGKRHTDSRTGKVLIVADPVPPTLSHLDRPLPRLPGARAESRAIAALIPASRVTRFEDDGARESIVREASAGKAVLHFATHAIVRDDDPFSSFLALTRSGDESDGLLTAEEVYRLRLDADLVVLSACRSAGGRVTGDGVATFARAFIYAGAPSIVASVWDVADEPTNRLLAEFYRRWLRGMSKARALRAAQLQLLNELRSGKVQINTPAGLVSLPEHPVFWAGFVLVGEPE